MQSKVVSVDSIQVKNRIRKEFGDIDSLAEDIRENGLINPVTLTPDGKLLAGERRLRAVKKLGWSTVDARIVEDPDDMRQLRIEISENEHRKEFTFSEKMAYAKLLHDQYDAEAKANSVANLKVGSDSPSASRDAVGRTSEKIAAEIGIGSSRTLERAEYVADHATPEMIASLDAEQLSINAAYKQLKEQAKKAEKEKEILEAKSRQLASDLKEAREDARREKAAKNQLEREEDETSEKMEELNLRIYDLQEKLDEAKVKTETYDELLKKYERASAMLKQNTETMIETEKALEALRNSSGIKRAGMVVDICDKIAQLSFELEEFDANDFAEMEPRTTSEITLTITNTIHSLENLRGAVQGAERKSA